LQSYIELRKNKSELIKKFTEEINEKKNELKTTFEVVENKFLS